MRLLMQKRLVARLVLGVGVLFSLTACTTTEEALVPAELTAFKSTAVVKTQWFTKLDGNIRVKGKGPFKTGRVYSRSILGSDVAQRYYLVMRDDILFAVTGEGNLYAINKKSGKKLWSKKIGPHLSAGLGIYDDTLFAATEKGEVLAISAQDGQTLWNATVSTEVVAPPQSNGREVLVSVIDGRVFALNAKTGERLWNYDHPQPLLTFRSQAKPLILDNQAFIAFDNGQLLSFGSREGDLRWSVRVSQPKGITELERAVDLDVTPVAQGPFILAAGANGRIVAVSRGTGKISWAEDASVFNELAVNDDAVFYVDELSHIYARRLTTGQTLWESKALHRRGGASPAVVGNYLAVIDASNYLHLFNVADGSLAARKSMSGNGYHYPMVVDGNTLYSISDNGALTAYTVAAKLQK